MKICIIGNSAVHTTRFMEWFVKKGHEVHHITDEDKSCVKHAIPYKIGNGQKGSVWNFLKKMRDTKRIVKAIKPDVLNAHYITGPGVFGAYADFHPYVITPYGSDLTLDPKSFFARNLIKYALSKADRVSAVEHTMVQRLKSLGVHGCCQRVEPYKIEHLRISTVNTELFNPGYKVDTVKQILAGDGNYLVVSTRPLTNKYNANFLIDVIQKTLETTDNVRFALAYSHSDGSVMDLLRKIKDERVTLLGSIPHEGMPKYLCAADVVIDPFSSFIEFDDKDEYAHIGTSSLEAMACGTPTLIANERMPFADGMPYVQYYPNDVICCRDRLVELLKDEQQRKKVSDMGYSYATAIGDENTNMLKWEELFERLIKSN